MVVAGCSPAPVAREGSGGSSAGSNKVGKVVDIPGLTGNPFYTTVGCGAAEAKASNVKFSVQGAPEFDVAEQTQIVNALTASKPDAIMISITDPKAMIAPLAQPRPRGSRSSRSTATSPTTDHGHQHPGRRQGRRRLAGERWAS